MQSRSEKSLLVILERSVSSLLAILTFGFPGVYERSECLEGQEIFQTVSSFGESLRVAPLRLSSTDEKSAVARCGLLHGAWGKIPPTP